MASPSSNGGGKGATDMLAGKEEYRGPVIMQLPLMDYHRLTQTRDISEIIMGQSVSRAERFWQACAYGHYVLVKRLLEEGDVDVNWISNIHNCSPIHVAAQGNPQVVQLLLAAGCDVNAADPNGNVALHHAAMSGDDEVVQILLSSGPPINVNQQNRYGWSPLINACYYGHTRCVRLLLDRAADVHLRNKDGRTGLLELCRSRCTQRHQNGHSAQAASQEKPLETSDKHDSRTAHRQSRKSGEKLPAKSNGDRSSSTSPTNDKEMELARIAEMLLDAGANIDDRAAASRNGEMYDVDADFTPLMFACYHSHYALAKVLLERGADVNACDENGWTALHWATERDNRDIVCLLLSYKCDPRAKDRRDQMALDRAKSAQLRSLLYSASQCSNGYVTTDDELDEEDDDEGEGGSEGEGPRECELDEGDEDAAEWDFSHSKAAVDGSSDPDRAMHLNASASGETLSNMLSSSERCFARAETTSSIGSLQLDCTDSAADSGHVDAFQ